MDEEPQASQPLTIEGLKSKILFLVGEPDSLVSTIYSTYVRPFCEGGASYAEFLVPKEELFRAPATIQKIRLFLFQVMTQLDVFYQENVEDPLDGGEYKQILLLVRMISPLAAALGGETLVSFMNDLMVTHMYRYPQTIERLQSDLGLAEKRPVWEGDRAEKRIHYQDSVPVPQKPQAQPQPAVRAPPHGLFLNRPSLLSRTVKLRIKKSKHGKE